MRDSLWSGMYLGMIMRQISLRRILLHLCSVGIPKFVCVDKYMEESYPEPGAREGVGVQFLAPDSDPE